jgi:hypothetical protein
MQQYFRNCQNIVRNWHKQGPMLIEPPEPYDKSTSGSGCYLFKDRNTIVRYFKPNFLPPYDTEEKRNIIGMILSKTWDDDTLSWVKSERVSERKRVREG